MSTVSVHIVCIFVVLHSLAISSVSRKICIQHSTEQNNGCSKCDWYGNLSDTTTRHVEDDTNLEFCSSRISLLELIHIANKTNVSVHGSLHYSTEVHCKSVEDSETGLMFTNITQLQISYVSFHGCGAIHKGLSVNRMPFLASVYIYYSINVGINHVSVEDGNGTGLAIIDTTGYVEVTYSMFKNNGIKGNGKLSGGRGVYVDFTYCQPGTVGECEEFTRNNKYSTYVFSHNIFENNTASLSENYDYTPVKFRAQKSMFQEIGIGGGLTIYIRADAISNNITIEHSTFLRNEAILGGALLVNFHDSPKNNSVVVRNCSFCENLARNGGGGVDVGFLFFGKNSISSPSGNSVIFDDCNMTSNVATYGGGTKIFSTRSFSSGLNNRIMFNNCQWAENLAQFGSAVEISPHVWDVVGVGHFPNVEFRNVKFVSNFRVSNEQKECHSANYSWGKGTFLTTAFPVAFSGNITFLSSNSSSLYISSSIVEFAAGSVVEFKNNTAFEGGAVALTGLSALHVQDNSMFVFNNNTALSRGGAIIHLSNNKLDAVSSRSCFIQYVGDTESMKERAITFQFQHNKVDFNQEYAMHVNEDAYGQTIYATTIIPCKRGCIGRDGKMSHHGLDCIGNFEFSDKRNREVSTSGARFLIPEYYNQKPINVIPGQEIDFQFQLLDDLNYETFDSYHVQVERSSGSQDTPTVILDPIYRYITDKKVRLYGNPGDRAYIRLGTTGTRDLSISLEIQMVPCPTGYVIKFSKCVCSSTTHDKTYVGIEHCDDNELKAYMKRGYWFGYDGDVETEENLKSGYCPRGFCLGNDIVVSNGLVSNHFKPDNVSLNEFVCSKFRQGKLCGSCVENHSHFFHSDNFNCYADKFCEIGLLLYIVSEIVPVSIMFIIIIHFNVNLTSGAINGFIFFVQFIDTMLVDANGFIQIHPTINIFMSIYKFVYRMFNLNFFTLDSLSFCLWKAATILDVLAFKYVTIIYSLILVSLTVLLMKVCNITRLKRSLLFKFASSGDLVKGTVIHGFSTFFVMSYSQCVKVTLFLLTPSRIFSMGPPHKQSATKVVFYAGDFSYFQSDHFKYAIPAILFAVTLILIPPVTLIIYPLCYRFFAIFGLEESRFVRIVCKVVPLEKLKPQFDSFQGCFKDNYRFFAGLYFLFRVVPLITFLALYSLTKFYIALEIQLIVMFTLHATTYPYKKRWHNVLNTVLFADLAIINALTIYNYKTATQDDRSSINLLSGVQTFLVMLPMLYILCFICSHIVWKVKTKENKQTRHELTDTLSLFEYRQY